MLSIKNKQIVTSILDNALETGVNLKKDERLYYCPFCHHHKRKMNVNLETQKYHCWTCDAKGRSILSLVRRLNVDERSVQKIKDIYGDTVYTENKDVFVAKLQLPKEFKQLAFPPKSFNPLYNQAISYLKRRRILMPDIVKYNIGYCDGGLYKNRIIIPSYDANGELNYFSARAIFEGDAKYKNPPISRDVIVFENQISWSQPLTLIEGMFDSFSVKRNAIPLLGKYLLSKLKDKMKMEGVTEVTILLDADATKDSSKHTDFFLQNGIKVHNIIPTDKDAGDMGFETVTQMIKHAPETKWDDMILTKLKNL